MCLALNSIYFEFCKDEISTFNLNNTKSCFKVEKQVSFSQANY